MLFWCPYHERFGSYRRVGGGHLDLPEVDLTRVSKRSERAFQAAKRPTERRSREVDLSRLKGFLFEFRAKKGEWRDSSSEFVVIFGSL